MASILASIVPCWASAQGTDCDKTPALCAYEKPLSGLASAKAKADDSGITFRLDDLTEPTRTGGEYFVLAVARAALAQNKSARFDQLVAVWDNARVDKQVGAPPKGSGSTDLVSRPSTPELLGLAVQLGALTETVNGTAATFNANAEGAYLAIIGQPVVCLSCGDTFWRRLNFSASFDLSKQGTQQVTTTGAATPSTPVPAMVELPQSSRQLSSITARYDIANPLDPRDKNFKAAWDKAYKDHQQQLEDASTRLIAAVEPILKPLADDKAITELKKKYRTELEAAAAAGRDQLNQKFEEFFAALLAEARQAIPDLDQRVAVAAAAFAGYAQLNYDTVQKARDKQFTVQYTFNRPQSQPETHELKLIVGLNPKDSGALFTLNLAGSLYGQRPAGAKYGRVRDYQLAAQFDRPLGNTLTHPGTLTLAGYVQYQPDPSVLNIGPGNLAPGTNITLPQDAQVLLGTKGTLAILQAKITLNTKSGVNVPIAVSWANKTDLLNAHDVRGHIGITYDLNSIAQVFGGQGGQ